MTLRTLAGALTVLGVISGAYFSGCSQALPPLPTGGGGDTVCIDPNTLLRVQGQHSQQTPHLINFKEVAMPQATWASSDSVSAFFGSASVKLVVARQTDFYLVVWGTTGPPRVFQMSQGDESPTLSAAYFSNPQFSPDGNWIAFSTAQGLQGFALKVEDPTQPAWRVPLSVTGDTTADPHWVIRNGKPWIYFDNTELTVAYKDACNQFEGHTYQVALENDSTVDSLQTTGLPGLFRGGLSRDGVWAGTAYSPAGLYNTTTPSAPPILLAGRHQKCNPSMNPFAAGSPNSDFLMLLGFGGNEEYHTPIDSLIEGEHQNLWIHDKDDLIVWQGKLPDSSRYFLWDKPRWSTVPRFATAVAERIGEINTQTDCDIFAVQLPDLSSAARDTLYQAQGYLRLGQGGFNTDTYTHLWVGP